VSNTAPSVTSVYAEELEVRASRIRNGMFAVAQVSGVQDSTIQGMRDALATVEMQLRAEYAKVAAYDFRKVPVAARKFPCYCDSAYHPAGH
jgi:hypothetical protein